MRQIVPMIVLLVMSITLSSYKEHEVETKSHKPINKCRKLLERKIERMSKGLV
jgi:hypothetical protein